MGSQDVSEDEYLKDLISKIEAAHLGSKEEEGDEALLYPSRDEIIAEFSHMRSLSDRNYGILLTLDIPAPYAPCVRSSDELEPILISDMKMETHHRGRKIFLRVCTPVCRVNGLMMVTDDENETAVRLQLYHQPEEAVIPAAQLFEPGTVLLVKEPWFKRSVDGKFVLRVDHVSDLIRLRDQDERIPFKWRRRLVELDSAELKSTGLKHCENKEWASALEQYTQAIEVAEKHGDAPTAYFYRSMVNMQLKRPEEAFNDAVAINSKVGATEMGVVLEALCLYELQKFFQCGFKLREIPGLLRHCSRTFVKNVYTRLMECNYGVYDWQRMYQQAKNTPPPIDCGTFSKNVEVRESPGKGRGLFTTKAVVAGELLLCEKAFAYSFAGEGGVKQNALVDFETRMVFLGGHAEMLTRIVQKSYHAPETTSSFLELHHGQYNATPGVLRVDSMPVVDTFLISNIIKSNSFGSPRTTLGSSRGVLYREDPSQVQISENAQTINANGVWSIASYINHSCVENCRRSFIGDMIMIRATQDLPAGAELRFAYRNLDASEPYEESQEKLSPWKFSCTCYLCKKKKRTPLADMRQRQAQLQSLMELVVRAQLQSLTELAVRPAPVNMNQARTLLNKIDQTYKKSGQTSLKLTLQIGYHLLAEVLQRRGNLVEATSMLRRVLELEGFILASPAGYARQNSAVIEIKKWGAPGTEYSLYAIWKLYLLCMDNAVIPFSENELSSIATMEAYAKTAYSILIGENKTFTAPLKGVN